MTLWNPTFFTTTTEVVFPGSGKPASYMYRACFKNGFVSAN
jgi:hypothetical protein